MKLDVNVLKSPRGRAAVLGAAAIFIAYFVSWNAVLKPQFTVLSGIQKNRQAESQKVDLLKIIERQEAQIKERKPLFIASPEPSELVETLTRIAIDSGLTLQSVNPAQATAEGDFRKLSVTIEARADYHAIGKFLGNLEGQKVYFQIVSLYAAPRLDGDGKDALKVTVSIGALYPARGPLK